MGNRFGAVGLTRSDEGVVVFTCVEEAAGSPLATKRISKFKVRLIDNR